MGNVSFDSDITIRAELRGVLVFRFTKGPKNKPKDTTLELHLNGDLILRTDCPSTSSFAHDKRTLLHMAIVENQRLYEKANCLLANPVILGENPTVSFSRVCHGMVETQIRAALEDSIRQEELRVLRAGATPPRFP